MGQQKEPDRPDVVFRPYTWKGEDWVAIYIDGKDVRLPLDRGRVGWLAERLGAPVHGTLEARNPEYFRRKYPPPSPGPWQKPVTGVIRHPMQNEDGTWRVGPSRSFGPDAFSDSSGSPSPDEP
ncbi:MAG: hypothetical protein MUE39_10365 [Gammaproteobacteria bacterium]|jgi:hypothetical protein|nr:hypothetical protein [Gammaproteobacteria bacterium]